MSAHLIREDHAQLNVHPKGIYLMASYPVSALSGFDDDGDGALSERELKRHRADLRAQVLSAVHLTAHGQPAPLEGLLLNLSHAHGRRAGASHLIVMGRFKAVFGTSMSGGAKSSGAVAHPTFHFSSSLFSATAPSALKLRVRHGSQAQDYTLTSAHPRVMIRLA